GIRFSSRAGIPPPSGQCLIAPPVCRSAPVAESVRTGFLHHQATKSTKEWQRARLVLRNLQAQRGETRSPTAGGDGAHSRRSVLRAVLDWRQKLPSSIQP